MPRIADSRIITRLDGKGQFTVFGPTDDAFMALGLDETNIGDLPGNFLRDVLVYHVHRGRLTSADVLASDAIKMWRYGYLQQSAGVLTDNLGRDANIIVVDIEADNGIIHVIDQLVLPYSPES